MKHLFPPLLPKEDLRAPVLVLAAHPDDEVIGCGGMLAWHRSVGHAVTVAHMTDGAAGDPGQRYEDFAAERRREGAQALGHLGVDDIRSIGHPDGELPEHQAGVQAAVRQLIEEVSPKTLYSFFFTEAHRDHRAVAAAVASESDAVPSDCRCLLFGVNQNVVGGTMFDVSAQIEQKERALKTYKSQLAYNDFTRKILDRDHGATLNIEDAAVRHVELFADLRPGELSRVRDLAEPLYRHLLRDQD